MSLRLELDDPRSFATWAKVHDRVRSGEIPPEGEFKGPATTFTMFSELEQALHAADVARLAETGRAEARQLNRNEYQDTLRDLLGVERDYGGELLEDDRAHDFDKAGAALGTSAEHVGRRMCMGTVSVDEDECGSHVDRGPFGGNVLRVVARTDAIAPRIGALTAARTTSTFFVKLDVQRQ